jgi:hypothetical protein
MSSRPNAARTGISRHFYPHLALAVVVLFIAIWLVYWFVVSQ